MINVQGTAGFTLKQVSAISPNWIIEPLTSRASPSSDMMNSNSKSNDNTTTKSTSHSAAEQDLFCVGPDQSTNLFFRITPITTPTLTPTPSTTTDTRYKRDYWWIRTTTIYDETFHLHSLIYLFFLPIINNTN